MLFPLLVLAYLFSYETFGHVIIRILSLRFGTVFWYTLSRYMCVNFDPGAHVIYASGFALKPGVTPITTDILIHNFPFGLAIILQKKSLTGIFLF